MINLYVGYDPREAAVYHTFCQSVIEQASVPVCFIPLHKPMLDNFDGQQDATNAFIYSRYLIPHLQGDGWAIFCDGDMHVNTDIAELYALRDARKALQVVKHDYKTNCPRKYIGTPLQSHNEDYPRKNWASVVIWNCNHPSHGLLTPEFVSEASGSFLHRFEWLNDNEIGELPQEWNWLEGEYRHNPEAKLVHQTLGSPGFENYAKSDSSKDWNQYLLNALNMIGERPSEMVRRASWHNRGQTNRSHNIIRDTANGSGVNVSQR